jgi:hypothetical protein
MSFNHDNPNSSQTRKHRLDLIIMVLTIIGVVVQGISLVFQIKDYYRQTYPSDAAHVVATENQEQSMSPL